jgi:hypothetical protein
VDPRRLSWHELVALVGGAALAIGLFLPWYHADNARATIGSMAVPSGGGDFTGWEVHQILRWLWLAAAAAPFILTYIVVRGHKLSWARGEMTAVVAIAAFGLLFYVGLIEKPGEPAGLIHLKLGYVLPMVGVLLMLFGSALRASEVERARKPPGVL